MSCPKRVDISTNEVIEYLEDMKAIFVANNFKWTSLCIAIEAINELEMIKTPYEAQNVSEGSSDY